MTRIQTGHYVDRYVHNTKGPCRCDYNADDDHFHFELWETPERGPAFGYYNAFVYDAETDAWSDAENGLVITRIRPPRGHTPSLFE